MREKPFFFLSALLFLLENVFYAIDFFPRMRDQARNSDREESLKKSRCWIGPPPLVPSFLLLLLVVERENEMYSHE